MTRYGGDCYGYCLLAAGFVDLVVEAGLKPYDIVALIPIIERAGGRVTTWDGEPATPADASLPQAMRGCTRRPCACLIALNRSGDLHVDAEIGVERRPEAGAHGVVLLQDLMAASPASGCRTTTLARTAKSSTARVETTVSLPAANISSGTLMRAGKSGAASVRQERSAP